MLHYAWNQVVLWFVQVIQEEYLQVCIFSFPNIVFSYLKVNYNL